MTKLNKARITVDELLREVRLEVAKEQGYNPENNSLISITSPIIAEDLSYVGALIDNAESRANIRTKWPDKYDKFPFNLSKKIQKLTLKLLQIIFVDQREVNFSLIQALKKSMLVNEQLVEELAELKEQAKTFDERLVELRSQADNSSEKLIKLKQIEQRLNVAESKIDDFGDRATQINNKVEKLTRKTDDFYELHLNNYSYFKNELSQQKRLIAVFLEEAHQRLPGKFDTEQLQNFVSEEQHLLDAFYTAFEDRFRGSREEITNRLKVYLPWIEAANIGTQEFPILDIGCGRGEWLELLKSSGFVARGLDINRVMVEQCQARGFDIVEGDALACLQSLPTNSLGAVTGFHIIEHLPFNVLIELLNETNRVLTTGGIAIFETPNPDNILVGSNTFYLDPTHRNPLPSQTIKFVVEYCNFCNVQILNLNRSDIPNIAELSEVSQRFNEYFYGYRDYAVIGFKS